MMTELLIPLAVALGGAIGAAARFLLDKFVPAGVLVANVLGSLLIGLLFGALDEAVSSGAAEPLPYALVAMVTVGLLGALGTFATVSIRAAQLWIHHQQLRAVGLWLSHSVLGLAAALLGIWLGHQFMS